MATCATRGGSGCARRCSRPHSERRSRAPLFGRSPGHAPDLGRWRSRSRLPAAGFRNSAAVAQCHAVLAWAKARSRRDRVEPEPLVAALRPAPGSPGFSVRCRRDGDARCARSRSFGQCGGAIERRCVGNLPARRPRAPRVGNAEPAHEFHGACVEGGGARMVGRSLALLDHQEEARRAGRDRLASARPTGPAPTIRIGISAVRVRDAILGGNFCGKADAGLGRRRAGWGRHIHVSGCRNSGGLPTGWPWSRGSAPGCCDEKSPAVRRGKTLTAWEISQRGKTCIYAKFMTEGKC